MPNPAPTTGPEFQAALDAIDSASHWKVFEDLAIAFILAQHKYCLAEPTRAPNGDGGMDAVIRHGVGNIATVFQISTQRTWKAKLSGTLATLAANGVTTRRLIYVTHLPLKEAEFSSFTQALEHEYDVMLQVHARSWFLTAFTQMPAGPVVVRPLMQAVAPNIRGGATSGATSLAVYERDLAAMHLVAFKHNSERNDELTRSSMDGLALYALKGTTKETSLTIDEAIQCVRGEMKAPMPSLSEDLKAAVVRLKNSQSVRATGTPVRYYLSDEKRLEQETAYHALLASSDALTQDIQALVEELESAVLPKDHPRPWYSGLSQAKRSALVAFIRKAISTAFAERGEEFVKAYRDKTFELASTEGSIKTLVADILAESPVVGIPNPIVKAIASGVLWALAPRASDESRNYLFRLSSAYTLLAYMRQTADVQRAMNHVVGGSEIWLDAGVILILVSETLVGEVDRGIHRLFSRCATIGIRFHVTTGVLEEVVTHLERSQAYCNTARGYWVGGVPLMAAEYAAAGQPQGSFAAWKEEFFGPVRREDDLADYLLEAHGIRRTDLQAEVDGADQRVRVSVDAYWRENHSARRRESIDDQLLDRLISHDVENYIGVMERRRSPGLGVGHEHWWLTLDRFAFSPAKRLRDSLADLPGLRRYAASPAMSLDFLATFVSMQAPETHAITALEPTHAQLAIAIPAEFEMVIDGFRDQLAQMGQRIRHRFLRDTIDILRTHTGPLTASTLGEIRSKVRLFLVG